MNPSKPKQTFNDELFTVAEETFESLAFMLLMPDEEDPPAEAWGYVCQVEFTGPFNGQVWLAVSPDMLAPLGANMLGIDLGEEAPPGVKLEDALKELLNVICGNLLPAVAGTEVIFQIGGPMILEQANMPEEVPGCEFKGQADLTLDSGRAQLKFFVDAGANLAVSDAGIGSADTQ